MNHEGHPGLMLTGQPYQFHNTSRRPKTLESETKDNFFLRETVPFALCC